MESTPEQPVSAERVKGLSEGLKTREGGKGGGGTASLMRVF